ncbi:hypothetical protein [Candidatus Nitrosocosmicus arcticus]|uniref:Uncharacterized protein n=1 Tax=Candidatus Nitrosocosmicus arcticus TaxID=2035267 RepID=A0A557SXI8_9ARCH|nr:hypothetical protein [Candidatus Nitrosocosmicus arcticus]TVP41319.1 exported protein of unknown function [Candidatus Nitrosocosmicus arcticus]
MQIKHRLTTSVIISKVLLLVVTSLSFLGIMEYSAYGEKDIDQSQSNKQNSNCEAGEDNNNSCNNISIARNGGGDSGSAGGSGNGEGNQIQVSKQNSNCEAGEDNNNSCNNFDLKEMISDRLKMLRQT